MHLLSVTVLRQAWGDRRSMNRVQKKEMCVLLFIVAYEMTPLSQKKKNKLLHINLKIEGGSEFASNLYSFSEQKRCKALSVLTP